MVMYTCISMLIKFYSSVYSITLFVYIGDWREPGLSRAELTVDKCLNWISLKLLKVESFWLIFG